MGSISMVLEISMCASGGLSLFGVELWWLRIVAVLCVEPSRELGRSLIPAFPRREAPWQHGRGDSAIFVGLEVRLCYLSSPVPRVSPVPVVASFRPGCRLCAGLSGKIMSGCRSVGVSLKGAGHAQLILVFLFW